MRCLRTTSRRACGAGGGEDRLLVLAALDEALGLEALQHLAGRRPRDAEHLGHARRDRLRARHDRPVFADREGEKVDRLEVLVDPMSGGHAWTIEVACVRYALHEHVADLAPRRDRRRHDLPRPPDRPPRQHVGRDAHGPDRVRHRDPDLPALGCARARRRARRDRRLRPPLGPGRRAGTAPRRRADRRPDEPRLLRPLDEEQARDAARRPGRGGGRRVHLAHVDREPDARPAAGAADRDRHRPAQLRRGARDRPVRRRGRGLARARPDHRLRAAQRDRGLRHRRPDGRRGRAAELGLPRR